LTYFFMFVFFLFTLVLDSTGGRGPLPRICGQLDHDQEQEQEHEQDEVDSVLT
jgi:hypothetical protein